MNNKEAIAIVLKGSLEKLHSDTPPSQPTVETVLYLLMKHRLLGYFTQNNPEFIEENLPVEAKKDINYLIHSYKRTTLERISCAKLISKKLKDENIPHAYVKNIESILDGGSMSLRRANDLDLIIELKNQSEITSLMKSIGFTQTYGERGSDGKLIEATKKEIAIQKMYYHDLVPFCMLNENLPTGFIEVDFNFKVESKDDNLASLFLKETKDLDGCPVLSPINSMAFLMIHYHREYKGKIWEETGRKFLLYKLIDIVIYIKKNKWITSDLLLIGKKFNIEEAAQNVIYHLQWLNQYVDTGIEKKSDEIFELDTLV